MSETAQGVRLGTAQRVDGASRLGENIWREMSGVEPASDVATHVSQAQRSYPAKQTPPLQLIS